MEIIELKIMDIWEKQYKKYGQAAQRRYPNENLIRFLNVNFSDKKGNILELGCGSGANLWLMAKEGFNAYGIDTSPTALSLCEKTLNYWGVAADIKLGDIRKLNFKNEFFEAIVDIVAVQHLNMAEHIMVYKEIFRCLKKGGYFFQWHLGARSISFLKSGGKQIDKLTVDDIINSEVPFSGCGLICFLTPTDAKEMLRSAGFKKISIELHDRTYGEMTQSIEYLAITAKKI